MGQGFGLEAGKLARVKWTGGEVTAKARARSERSSVT
jgi:hypothetical protein